MANKIEFRTAYSGQVRHTVPAGTGIEDVYGYERDSFGRKVLVKTGETDLYAKIQMSLEETKIENIMARAVAGDTSMLRPDGLYADLSEVPNNMIDAMKQIQNLENTWAGLDNEIKRKYNFNVEEFIGQSGTEGWLRDMGLLAPQAEAVAEAINKVPEGKAPKTIDAGGEVNE